MTPTQILSEVRNRAPRASLVYALIVLRLMDSRKTTPMVNLCVDIDGNPNSSTVNQAVRSLERMGVVIVDKAPRRNDGHTVRMATLSDLSQFCSGANT